MVILGSMGVDTFIWVQRKCRDPNLQGMLGGRTTGFTRRNAVIPRILKTGRDFWCGEEQTLERSPARSVTALRLVRLELPFEGQLKSARS
jgi:hypothetical protein